MIEDNYFKMVLINMRAHTKIPIVIMGETGCGKTALVNFFVKYILKEEFEVFNFHAGITQAIIIEKMN